MILNAKMEMPHLQQALHLIKYELVTKKGFKGLIELKKLKRLLPF